MNGTEAPTIDEAIELLGREHVRDILRSGRAYMAGISGFEGRAVAAGLGRGAAQRDAYTVLAGTPEAVVWQATRSMESLHEAFLEGSPSAYMELARRHKLPQSAALQPAWL